MVTSSLIVLCCWGSLMHAMLCTGAQPNIETKTGHTALIAAAESGHTEIIQMLSAANADLHLMTTRGAQAGTAAVHRAATHAQLPSIEMLAFCAADLNQVRILLPRACFCQFSLVDGRSLSMGTRRSASRWVQSATTSSMACWSGER